MKKKHEQQHKVNIWGAHAVHEAWLNPEREIKALFVTQQALGGFDLKSPVKRPPPSIVTKNELDRLTAGAVHQGIAILTAPLSEVFVQDMAIEAAQDDNTVLLMLDQVTDPHNIGAIMRSACVFGASGVIMQRKHSPELSRVLAKTACGAVEHVPVAYEINLSDTLDILKDHGFTAIGLDERGEQVIGSLSASGKTVLVLGAEGKGLRPKVREHCDMLVRLPASGPIQSLNVSNAAAVALYALGTKN